MKSMHLERSVCAAAGMLMLAGCAQFPIAGEPANTGPQSAPVADGWSGSRLYARDGSVVGPGDSSPQDARTAAPRELESADGGRMYILELYQKAIDERDALHGELAALRTELRTVQEALVASEADLDKADAELEALRIESQRRLDENVELAARLTTAQIRRLQVERILLQLRIDELRLAQPTGVPDVVSESAEKKP